MELNLLVDSGLVAFYGERIGEDFGFQTEAAINERISMIKTFIRIFTDRLGIERLLQTKSHHWFTAGEPARTTNFHVVLGRERTNGHGVSRRQRDAV